MERDNLVESPHSDWAEPSLIVLKKVGTYRLVAFQNLVELISAGLSYEMALVFLDDVIVYGTNFDEHLK